MIFGGQSDYKHKYLLRKSAQNAGSALEISTQCSFSMPVRIYQGTKQEFFCLITTS